MVHWAESSAPRLGAAFTRLWTLNPRQHVRELRVRAGMYTQLDGPQNRLPVGQFKIGRVAQDRQTSLTNALIGDSPVGGEEGGV
jgi:hypothetical protein